MTWDVVTLGETMLRLTPPELLRWEQASTFQIHIGGSESNTAVGLARLGRRVCWISRLPNHALGRMVAASIASHAVDVSHVRWTDQDRLGVYYFEEGSPPRSSQVIYDRAGSAFSRIQPDDLPREIFFHGNAKCLHITGISLGLSDSAAATITLAVELAKEANWQISFDSNFRSKLWSTEKASQVCESVMQHADILFIPRRDASQLFQIPIELNPDEAMSSLRQRFPKATIVMTLGEQGAIASDDQETVQQRIEAVTPLGRLGGGDAFSAGFLSSYLENESLPRALAWANAAAVTKYSIRGDLPIFDRAEVQRLVDRSHSGALIR